MTLQASGVGMSHVDVDQVRQIQSCTTAKWSVIYSDNNNCDIEATCGVMDSHKLSKWSVIFSDNNCDIESTCGVMDRHKLSKWSIIFSGNNNCDIEVTRRVLYNHKLSPTPMLKWPGVTVCKSSANHVQIMCTTSGTHHVQHVVCYVVGRDSSAAKCDRI